MEFTSEVVTLNDEQRNDLKKQILQKLDTRYEATVAGIDAVKHKFEKQLDAVAELQKTKFETEKEGSPSRSLHELLTSERNNNDFTSNSNSKTSSR